MANFMMAYYGGTQPSSEEEGMAHINKGKACVASLGDKVFNSGTALPVSKIVTSRTVEVDNDHHSIKGFTVDISKSDPFLEIGGIIRISEMMKMS